MAKGEGKKVKRKGNELGPSNAKMKKVQAPISPTKTDALDPPAPIPEVTVSAASGPENKTNEAASPSVKANEESKHIFGFIFMCNSSTKIECYQYRVFGLPFGQQEVVKQIKPGAKLFLFDFQSKVLYGVYEATSAGKMNLEPAAFQGRFPAQVKFKIFKECLPMPERFLRSVINENYTGSRFNQDLSRKQVKKLISAFRPLFEPSSQPASQAFVNASQPHAMLPLAMENQFRFTGRPPAMEIPSLYLPGMYHRVIPAFSQPQHITDVTLQHGLCSLPATSSYVTHGTQDPHYSRAIGDRALQEGPSALSFEMRYHQLGFHHSKPEHTQYTPSVMRPESYVNRGPPVQYTPSVMQSQPQAPPPQVQPYVPVSCPQLPLQKETQHQNTLTRYNYHAGGSATQHASLVAVAQPQPPPLQPPAGASQGVGLVSCYSHVLGNQPGSR